MKLTVMDRLASENGSILPRYEIKTPVFGKSKISRRIREQTDVSCMDIFCSVAIYDWRGWGGLWQAQFTLSSPRAAIYFETWLVWAFYCHQKEEETLNRIAEKSGVKARKDKAFTHDKYTKICAQQRKRDRGTLTQRFPKVSKWFVSDWHLYHKINGCHYWFETFLCCHTVFFSLQDALRYKLIHKRHVVSLS